MAFPAYINAESKLPHCETGSISLDLIFRVDSANSCLVSTLIPGPKLCLALQDPYSDTLVLAEVSVMSDS